MPIDIETDSLEKNAAEGKIPYVKVGKGKKLHYPSPYFHRWTQCGISGELVTVFDIVEPRPDNVCRNCLCV